MRRGWARRFCGFTALAVLATGCVGAEPTLPSAPECAASLELCGESCVDTSTDPLNCGACGMSCDVAHGGACVDGSCGFTAVSPCTQGLTSCGALCVDTMTSAAHCGDCATACDSAGGEVCSNGSCALACAGGATECDGGCVNIANDPAHCGKCGTACSDGQVCSDGKCALDCSGGASLCGKSCVDLTSDPLHCGDCRTACATSAGESCEGGQCTFACSDGATQCGDACVDTNVDPAHCGGCDVSCAADATCEGGKCACADGYAGDGRTCSDIDECATANDCSPNGACLNTPGGYVCTCRDDQSGDGKTCTGLELVTVSYTGGASSGAASAVALSDDGRYVAFVATGRDFLDASLNPPNGARQAYERDMLAKTTALASVSEGGALADIGVTDDISISGDGSLVGFTTAARNLGVDDGGEISNVFVHDFSEDVTVPRSITGLETAPGSADWPRLSDDGGTLVFSSERQLTDTDNQESDAVYLSTGSDLPDALVSLTNGGELATAPAGCDAPATIDAQKPSVSSNGQRVVFESAGIDFTDDSDDNCARDVFLRDYTDAKKPTTVLLSANTAGDACTDASLLGSSAAVISADGSVVAFASNCVDLLAKPDQLTHRDVFVRSLASGTVTRVSVTATGAEANGDSDAPQISADGRYVAFTSLAGDLVARDTNGVADVFVRDLVKKTTVRVDLDANGAEIASGASTFAFSPNGAVIAFVANEALLPQDRSEGRQIYLRYLR